MQVIRSKTLSGNLRVGKTNFGRFFSLFVCLFFKEDKEKVSNVKRHMYHKDTKELKKNIANTSRKRRKISRDC